MGMRDKSRATRDSAAIRDGRQAKPSLGSDRPGTRPYGKIRPPLPLKLLFQCSSDHDTDDAIGKRRTSGESRHKLDVIYAYASLFLVRDHA